MKRKPPRLLSTILEISFEHFFDNKKGEFHSAIKNQSN